MEMIANPCRSCDRLLKSKNVPRCRDCERKFAYLASQEQSPECRQDPAYAMAYSIPRGIIRSLGPLAPISAWDLIPL